MQMMGRIRDYILLVVHQKWISEKKEDLEKYVKTESDRSNEIGKGNEMK